MEFIWQAASVSVLRTVVTSGHESKLIVAFTHFDEVKGVNLIGPKAQKEHVVGSFFNAVQASDPVNVPFPEKTLAAKSAQQTEAYSKRLQDGPEKRELDAFGKPVGIAGAKQRADDKLADITQKLTEANGGMPPAS